jgi:hypothetical protein
MTLTPPTSLVPGVEETDRLVFRVPSRSRKRTHEVDMEQRQGLGFCECEDCRINGNVDCFHIQQVRKYIACRLAQAVILSHEKKP